MLFRKSTCISAAIVCAGLGWVVQSANADYITGLVARYDFEEGSGTTANDTGNTPGGHPGTLAATSTPTYVAGNVGNYALQFNGGSGVTVPHSADFAALTSYSVSAWFNVASLGVGSSQQCIFSTRGGTDNTLDFKVGSGGTSNYDIHGDIGDGNGNWLSTQANNNSVHIGTNEWYLLTYTVTAGTAKIYINDGTSNTFDGSTTSIALSPSTSNPDLEGTNSFITIGSQNGGENFNGKIDDVRIYNAVLTPAQVAQIYSSGQVPEPASLGLLGLAGLGLLSRRRQVK